MIKTDERHCDFSQYKDPLVWCCIGSYNRSNAILHPITKIQRDQKSGQSIRTACLAFLQSFKLNSASTFAGPTTDM